MRFGRCLFASMNQHKKSGDATRDVLRFTFRHWREEPRYVALIVVTMMVSTLADVFMPVFAGRLVDAIAAGGTTGAQRCMRRLIAFGFMTGLGLLMIVMRHLAFYGIVELTLRVMGRVAQDAFARVQRFSTDWHANSFAGSTVRKITRGMWALDLMHDTLLLALLPSLTVLAGSMIVLGLRWPVMGLVIGVSALAYIVMTALSRHPLCRAGGAAGECLGYAGRRHPGRCLELQPRRQGVRRRDRARTARLTWVLGKWQSRTRRVWQRGTNSGTVQFIALLGIRAAIIGTAIWLWWDDRATPGDLAYVLTTYFVIHGYLRDVGMHINNLRRSVNDMEELVEIHRERIGVPDRARCDADPHRARRGRVRPRHVPLWRARHAALPGSLADDPRRRARRPRRAFGIRQDDPRQADPAPLRRDGRRDPHRRAEHRRCTAGVAARRRSPSCSRSRSCSTARSPRTSPMGGPAPAWPRSSVRRGSPTRMTSS